MSLSVDIEVLSGGTKNWVTVVEEERHLQNIGAHLGRIFNEMPLNLPVEIKLLVSKAGQKDN